MSAAEPRRCVRCERTTTEWIVQPNESDRGPLEVAWCEDATACQQYRARLLVRMPRRFAHP